MPRKATRKRKPKRLGRIAFFRLQRVIRYGASGSHTYSEIKALLRAQGYKCKVCSISIKRKSQRDHIVPLCRGGSDDIHNIQMLCRKCNLSKGSKLMSEWKP